MRRGGQRSRVAPSVYRAVFAITFDPTRCLSLSLPLVLHLSSVLAAVSLPSLVLARYGTMRLRCANDRAADIGNYSLRDSRARLLLFFLFVSALSSPIVLACPSHLLLLFSRRFILRSRTVGLTRRKARSPSAKEIATRLL